MSNDPGPAAAPITTLPRSIRVVAWSSLVGQVVVLLGEGVLRVDATSLVISCTLSGLLVGYVSAGVVRARPVRTAIAWVVLVLIAILQLVAIPLVDASDAVVLAVSSVLSAVTLAALWRFRGTEWYAWQRTRPPTTQGARVGGLVAMAVLTGVLGGLVGSAGDGGEVRLQLTVAGRP